MYYENEFVLEIKTSVVDQILLCERMLHQSEVNSITHFLICLFYLNLTEKSDDWNQAEYLPGPIIVLKLLRMLMTRLSDAGRKRDNLLLHRGTKHTLKSDVSVQTETHL